MAAAAGQALHARDNPLARIATGAAGAPPRRPRWRGVTDRISTSSILAEPEVERFLELAGSELVGAVELVLRHRG